MHDARVLDDRKVGAERKLLEDAAHAAGARSADRHSAPAVSPPIAILLMRCEAAVDDVDDGGLAGAIVSDKPDAFARHDAKGHAIECPDGAETHLGAIDGDHRLQNVIHAARHAACKNAARPSRLRGSRRETYFADAMTLLASVLRVFHVGDAAGLGIGEVGFEIVLVDAQEGTTRSFVTSLPSRICWATQKASVETPGAMETDMVS